MPEWLAKGDKQVRAAQHEFYREPMGLQNGQIVLGNEVPFLPLPPPSWTGTYHTASGPGALGP